MNFFRNTVILICLSIVLWFNCCESAPVSSPDAAFEIMSHIPQWHCLRYRKFELVRRCRSFKSGFRRL